MHKTKLKGAENGRFKLMIFGELNLSSIFLMSHIITCWNVRLPFFSRRYSTRIFWCSVTCIYKLIHFHLYFDIFCNFNNGFLMRTILLRYLNENILCVMDADLNILGTQDIEICLDFEIICWRFVPKI